MVVALLPFVAWLTRCYRRSKRPQRPGLFRVADAAIKVTAIVAVVVIVVIRHLVMRRFCFFEHVDYPFYTENHPPRSARGRGFTCLFRLLFFCDIGL